MNNQEKELFWKSVLGLGFPGGAGDVKYALHKLRGFGGYGAVFEADRCREDAFEKTVAIKLFLIDLRNPNDLTRKMNELATQTRENHKHIVATPAHGMGAATLDTAPGKPTALFMELELADKDLEDEADRVKAERAKLLRLLADIGQGLAFLHERDRPVVHRDIKPGNLLYFEKQGIWKLGDLGLARVLSQKGKASHSKPIGTSWYMAPEAFKSEVVPANDMWSLGVLLVWLLTGKEPFGADTETPEEIMHAVFHCAPDLGTVPLPAPFDAIVRGCLEKDWQKRMDIRAVLELLGMGRATPVNRSRLPEVELIHGRNTEQVRRLQLETALSLGLSMQFRDTAQAPEMVVIPSGKFLMGSPKTEKGRYNDEGDEPHEVTISLPFALGRYPVTVGEFQRFVEATKYRTEGEKNGKGIYVYGGKKDWVWDKSKSWRDPGFSQDERHPVTGVSWNDAEAYVKWLSTETGKFYRLPSEAEWEYACRAGTTTARYWGEDPAGARDHARVANRGIRQRQPEWPWRIHEFDDTLGFIHTAPVGSYRANAFGLHDMIGNVWELLEDCWNEDYQKAPDDGSAWTSGDCSVGVLRGGSWTSIPDRARSASRIRIIRSTDCSWFVTTGGHSDFGFRLAACRT